MPCRLRDWHYEEIAVIFLRLRRRRSRHRRRTRDRHLGVPVPPVANSLRVRTLLPTSRVRAGRNGSRRTPVRGLDPASLEHERTHGSWYTRRLNKLGRNSFPIHIRPSPPFSGPASRPAHSFEGPVAHTVHQPAVGHAGSHVGQQMLSNLLSRKSPCPRMSFAARTPDQTAIRMPKPHMKSCRPPDSPT